MVSLGLEELCRRLHRNCKGWYSALSHSLLFPRLGQPRLGLDHLLLSGREDDGRVLPRSQFGLLRFEVRIQQLGVGDYVVVVRYADRLHPIARGTHVAVRGQLGACLITAAVTSHRRAHTGHRQHSLARLPEASHPQVRVLFRS